MRAIGLVFGVAMSVCVAAGTPLGAQVTLHPGAKVRIDAPSIGVRRFQGIVIASGDTIDVAQGNARVRAPASAVTRLEVSRGKSRLVGAGWGALWGAGLGLGIGALTTSRRDTYSGCKSPDPSLQCDSYSTGEWLAINAAGGVLWGGLIGAMVGREQWDVIAVPGATRTSMTIRPWAAPAGRVGVVATLR